MLRTVVFYTSSGKDILSLLEVVWKKYSVIGNTSEIKSCYKKRLVICPLQYENSLSIKELMTDILIRSVRI